jgi:hypothetical protein
MFARFQLAVYMLLCNSVINTVLKTFPRGKWFFVLLFSICFATQQQVFYLENVPSMSFEGMRGINFWPLERGKHLVWKISWKTAKSIVMNFAICSNYIYFM